jgi:hypothetical protein
MAKLTEVGLLSERPAPAAIPDGYYYATDEGKYYKSSGDVWREINPDLENIDPTRPISIIAGVANQSRWVLVSMT